MLRVILPIYALLFYGIVFFWRSFRTWRVTGVNPFRLPDQDNIPGLASRGYRLVSIGVVGVLILFTLSEVGYRYLAPISWLQSSWVAGLGLALLATALLWILMAQAQMGNAWRIGIDEENPTDLITQGIFRISRNPIFLGMRVNLAGLFLVLPNAVTLALWLLGDVTLQVQVYLEEDYLRQVHGNAYEEYTRQVRRWL